MEAVGGDLANTRKIMYHYRNIDGAYLQYYFRLNRPRNAFLNMASERVFQVIVITVSLPCSGLRLHRVEYITHQGHTNGACNSVIPFA